MKKILILVFSHLVFVVCEIQKSSLNQNVKNENFVNGISNGIFKSTGPRTPENRLGRVSAPFYFFCHHHRPGEPIEVGSEDVTISFNVTGQHSLDSGYKPQTLYELLVRSSIALDGFLLTGVYSPSREFLKSSLLHQPSSATGRNSAGNVCALLHSHISKKPKHHLPLLWVSPPSGTGCVSFLATGSFQDRIVFKDLLVKEICEQEMKFAEIKRSESILRSHDGGFVFKDDFEDGLIDSSTWDVLNGGIIERSTSKKDPGNYVVMNGNASFIQTKPLDFTDAKHFQFTLGHGDFNRQGKIRVLFGTISAPSKPNLKTSKLSDSKEFIVSDKNNLHLNGIKADGTTDFADKTNSELKDKINFDQNPDKFLAENRPTSGFQHPDLNYNTESIITDDLLVSESNYNINKANDKIFPNENEKIDKSPVENRPTSELLHTDLNYNTESIITDQSLVHESNSNIHEANDKIYPNENEIIEKLSTENRPAREFIQTDLNSNTESIITDEILLSETDSRILDSDMGETSQAVFDPLKDDKDILQEINIFDSNGSEEIIQEGFDVIQENVDYIMQSDQPSQDSCSFWEEIDVHTIPSDPEVHTRAIAPKFQTRGVCIKWQMMENEQDEKINNSSWTLDNVAVTNKHSISGPIVDDFDPVNPTNWFFFPGGKIQEGCGSDGNSLFFDGSSESNWAATRQVDLSNFEFSSSEVKIKKFSNKNLTNDGWTLVGAGIATCEIDQNLLSFQAEGKREICSNFIDTRAFGAIKVSGGVSSCSIKDNVSLSVFGETNGVKSKIRVINLRGRNVTSVVPLSTDFQGESVRLCLEQSGENKSGENGWNIWELSLLPWLLQTPEYFVQLKINTNCGYSTAEIDIEASNDGGSEWWSLHNRCTPGSCDGSGSSLTTLTAHGLDSGWTVVTIPIPSVALTANSRIRIRQLSTNENNWKPSWSLDYIYVGRCPQGCHGRGLCNTEGICRCEYGFVGKSCEETEISKPVFISEPFVTNIELSANILKVSGGEISYQCGVIGTGTSAVFKGRGLRYITTIDIDTTLAHLLEFNFMAGTSSDVGKCPGPDGLNEGIYVHYSCTGGAYWHLLHTLDPHMYKEPSHVSIRLPPAARNSSCRFQIWQEEHTGPGLDMWAIDDLVIASQRFNTIELTFDDAFSINNSLRFHLGNTGSICGRNKTLVFDDFSDGGLVRFLETKSVKIGASYMMQFDLVIGCDPLSYSDGLNSTIVLEYSLNHGLTWRLVRRPCTPSKPGCESHFTRGTVYHVSEFQKWKRVTLRLPKHTWSPTTRLRLRQLETSDVGLTWAVDNVYIGHQCEGLCSGHGHCTSRGCRCDEEFHGHKCLPLHKLHQEINADFNSEETLNHFGFQVIGGSLVDQYEGCGIVVSGKNLYFGSSGIRHFETDDINAEQLHSLSFYLVIGGDRGLQRACQSTKPQGPEDVSRGSSGSVVLEYSVDGSISWELIKELIPTEYRQPKQFHMELEEVLDKAMISSGVVRFRLWQPNHESEDQWAIDNFIVDKTKETLSVQADFRSTASIKTPWLRSSSLSQKKYCGSDHLSQVFESADPTREAVTDKLTLSEKDIITFQISVGCKESYVGGSSVRLEFSRDGGGTWNLVKEGCLSESMECRNSEEPSIYWPGRHGPWQRIQINLDHRFAHGDVQFRFIQNNPGETRGGEFALRDFYIGPPCPYSCMGHGLCTSLNACKCDEGFSGKFCGKPKTVNPVWIRDGFDQEIGNSAFWDRMNGKIVSAGCDPDHVGNVMFFSGDYDRFIITHELDTRNIKFLVFDLQIGSNNYDSRCQPGVTPRDDVIVEFSTDNGLSWSAMRRIQPNQTINRNRSFFIPVPRRAQTRQTKFRWWQVPYHMLEPGQGLQSEWQLDNVMVLANGTVPYQLSDDFTSSQDNVWFSQKGGETGAHCGSADPSLYFSGHSASRYAETWEFEATEATFLQFDIFPGCHSQKSPTTVEVLYSTNYGKTWHLMRSQCSSEDSECHSFDFPSEYSSTFISNWTRIALKFPREAVGEKTRVIFRQTKEDGNAVDSSSTWALDNLYVGDSCPWMCSGHGYCREDKCVCDDNYFGEFCVPAVVLPCELLDKFNEEQHFDPHKWSDVRGGENSNKCGTLVSKSALVFYKEGPRFATTIDMDMTAGHFVQFTLAMGCQGLSTHQSKANVDRLKRSEKTDSKVISVQFSINGGIRWTVIKNIRYNVQEKPIFISLDLSDFPTSKSNSTRFRLWQPPMDHNSMEDVWAIDNVYIGGLPVYSNVLYDDFNLKSPENDAWIDWPSGMIQSMCNSNENRSAIVFEGDIGENAIYTKDLKLDVNSIVQFEIKVGCGNITKRNQNISLEFSEDFGVTWTSLRSISRLYGEASDYTPNLQTPSRFYPNAVRHWRRFIFPVPHKSTCGNIRFRWWQDVSHSKENREQWALDNVYIGPACPLNCNGHGYCVNGLRCECDEGYHTGDYCASSLQNDQEINEDFEGNTLAGNFLRWSGAELSDQCRVLTDKNLLFRFQGERMLETKDLDLTHGSVVQFYLRFDCSERRSSITSHAVEPIVFQFSKDGGIKWEMIAVLHRESAKPMQHVTTRYFTISLPEASKTNSTRLRWWQPGKLGTFAAQWAIDEIYVGSTALSLPYFYDNGTENKWLLRPGSLTGYACDHPSPGIHFTKNTEVRFAETPDIFIDTDTFVQFEVSIGCLESSHCFDVVLEYSIDHGQSWFLVRESCLPSNPECSEYWSSSVLSSDLHSSLTLVTLGLPERAKWKLARFRFKQQSPWDLQHTWIVGRTYVGSGCPSRCSGRGICAVGQCICQEGWTGDDCRESIYNLPAFVADDFVESPSSYRWNKVIGAKISEICGPVASSSALHFYGNCNRLLETVNLDLEEALFIQFDFKFGCLHSEGSSFYLHSEVLVQVSCDAGITWHTLRMITAVYDHPLFVWIEIPEPLRCYGGRVRWWQPGSGPQTNALDWAIDGVVVGGKSDPPKSISLIQQQDLSFPTFLRYYNYIPGFYCNMNTSVPVFESTPTEPAIVQTTDIEITRAHSMHFRLALGCDAQWDNDVEPVSLEYSIDFGRTWKLVRELCLPFNATFCTEYHDESVFYAPQNWQYYVFPLLNLPPHKYVRFRWIQRPTADVLGSHKWALTDVYIGPSCVQHCLGRGQCINQKCFCNKEYSGEYCQNILIKNVPYIKDTFIEKEFLNHWQHLQGALLGRGCGEDLKEPPAVTFQGPHSRAIMSRPVDTRSARFVMFTAHIGSSYGRGICRPPSQRSHNVFLQYSIDGGIRWYLLRELNHNLYNNPHEEYIVLPKKAMTSATLFRFWQPRLSPVPPSWALDDVFIGGSEIGAAHLLESFNEEPTVTEWLFAPHSEARNNYCEKGDNGSLVWEANRPGQRSITTQELLVQDGHVLQFKISVGCQNVKIECSMGPDVRLVFSKDGGATGWDLVRDNCLPGTSPDPDCFPYTFHGPSTFSSDVYRKWTRVVFALPEKTFSSTTQLRWIQNARRADGKLEQILPWALDDVYVGIPCPLNCRGRGDCEDGKCHCDAGYKGETCKRALSSIVPLQQFLIEGFEGGIKTHWASVTGGNIGIGCSSLAPYGHGKHLYFNGCGTRQAVTKDLDIRGASKVMYVLRIGSHDNSRSCSVNLDDPNRLENKGVVFQFSPDNGISWTTIDVHNPLDFRKARRVAYSLPERARQNGVQLRWWQPDHNGSGTDQWALDNIELVAGPRKSTHLYETRVFENVDL